MLQSIRAVIPCRSELEPLICPRFSSVFVRLLTKPCRHKKAYWACQSLLALWIFVSILRTIDGQVGLYWYVRSGHVVFINIVLLLVELRRFSEVQDRVFEEAGEVGIGRWTSWVADFVIGTCSALSVYNFVLYARHMPYVQGNFLLRLDWFFMTIGQLFGISYAGTLITLYILHTLVLARVVKRFVADLKTEPNLRVEEGLQPVEDPAPSSHVQAITRAHNDLQKKLSEASKLWERPIALVLVVLTLIFAGTTWQVLVEQATPGWWELLMFVLVPTVGMSLLGGTLHVNSAASDLPAAVLGRLDLGAFLERVQLAQFYQSPYGQLHLTIYGFAVTRAFVLGTATTGISPFALSMFKKFT